MSDGRGRGDEVVIVLTALVAMTGVAVAVTDASDVKKVSSCVSEVKVIIEATMIGVEEATILIAIDLPLEDSRLSF